MRALHDSRKLTYRDPFGAVPCGGTVRVCLDTFEEEPAAVDVRLWSDTAGERFVAMESNPLEGGLRWSATIELDEPELLWYHFVLRMEDGSAHAYGAAEGRQGGEGVLWWEGEPPSFQITVYEPRAVKPDWFSGGVVYQIFPDRFCRDAAWHERAEAALGEDREGPGRVLVEDWDAPVRYLRDAEGNISCWEFYGGSLAGIRDKLSYLRDLGVTAIYLNPIFEAASCHRYDTADYTRIDPALGTEDDFRELCACAEEHGISIILDGVFNHVGQDSIYFNRYGNYPEPGAYQSEDSPYRSWFTFADDGSWESWWGVEDLPTVRADAQAFQEMIAKGRDSVVEKWLRAGARGWRLDVADELSEDFLKKIHAAALDARDDALVLGEVWEDASNKISYGELRHYLLGDELDGVMNYVWRDGILDFVRGRIGAPDLAEAIETLRENYPPEALAANLNLLGSHDRPRLMTLLGDAPDEASLTDAERAAYALSEGQRGLAKSRMWLAVLAMVSLPGVPSLYYGDEAGLEGYADPYNRETFPWGNVDADCTAIWRNAINLRKTLPELVEGGLSARAINDDVLLIERTVENGPTIQVVMNRSLEHVHEFELEALGSSVADVVGGQDLEVEDGRVRVRLPQLGSAVLYWSEDDALGVEPARGSGIVCHISSLPSSDGGPGTFGDDAMRFCDWLVGAGQHYWQILPLNPTDEYGSPYAGLSAFAGNLRLLDGGVETALRARSTAIPRSERSDYQSFCEKEDAWLTPYATFLALKEKLGESPWQTWPEEYRTFTPALAKGRDLREAVEGEKRAQYLFMKQWRELRAYANDRGIQIVGDMPMYVSADSADVWAHPELFMLDASGRPSLMAGAPPDSFAEDGQLWGNPTYRWDVMATDSYAWWMARLERAFELYDYVRLDHFLGFSAYFGVPAGHGAVDGTWRIGPGIDFFRKAAARFGKLPIIAEDLGTITPAVRALIASCNFAGMDVLEFTDSDVRAGYVPPQGKLAYSSTHDTATLLGWVREKFGDDGATELASALMHRVMDSRAPVAMFPLQDALGLGDESRMNTPGVAEGNWTWQAEWTDIEAATARMREMAERAGR